MFRLRLDGDWVGTDDHHVSQTVWPDGCNTVQSLAIHNSDNLPRSIKMPKLVQKVAKYLIRYPKKTFCQSSEISPNLFTLITNGHFPSSLETSRSSPRMLTSTQNTATKTFPPSLSTPFTWGQWQGWRSLAWRPSWLPDQIPSRLALPATTPKTTSSTPSTVFRSAGKLTRFRKIFLLQ